MIYVTKIIPKYVEKYATNKNITFQAGHNVSTERQVIVIIFFISSFLKFHFKTIDVRFAIILCHHFLCNRSLLDVRIGYWM
jgi:hypothetical protein